MQAMIAIGQSSAVNYNYVNLISGCALWWQANNRIIKTHVVTQKSNKAFTVTQCHSARSCWCDACNNDYIIKSSKRQSVRNLSAYVEVVTELMGWQQKQVLQSSCVMLPWL